MQYRRFYTHFVAYGKSEFANLVISSKRSFYHTERKHCKKKYAKLLMAKQ